MKIYTTDTSFTCGTPFNLAVQPNSRFCLAVYRQTGTLALSYFSGVRPASMLDVEATHIQNKIMFQAGGDSTQKRFDEDWNWPTVKLNFEESFTQVSGAYIMVAYDVDAVGAPITDLGRRIEAGTALDVHPPDSDSMALLILRPQRPAALIAYIIPIATYHAYNSIGGGCFYDDNIHATKYAPRVSLRRPGGGLGGQMAGPPDPYDPKSPRQQFSHWDAKFIAWLQAQKIEVDFYSDLDLHTGLNLNLADYKCVLSVGHHEYWTQGMRDHVARFISAGGNLAVFSGNTCFRPIDFGPSSCGDIIKEINKLGERWSSPTYNEAQLLGLSYGYGGGKWGEWSEGKWTNTERDPVGFTVENAAHWAFAGTDLADGQTFGHTDRLVGYEADGVPVPDNGFTVLARSRQLTGWDVGGVGAMGIWGQETPSRTKLVFNCGTTDWARVLFDSSAASHVIVSRITRNVLDAFTGQVSDTNTARSTP